MERERKRGEGERREERVERERKRGEGKENQKEGGEQEGRQREQWVHEKRSMIMLRKAFVAGRMCLSNYPSSLLFTC